MSQTEDSTGETSVEQDEEDFRSALKVCGLNEKAIDGVIQNWFKSLGEMAEIRDQEEISEMFSTMLDYPNDDPRYFHIFSVSIMKLKALHYWLRYHQIRQKPIQMKDWTPEAMAAALGKSSQLKSDSRFRKQFPCRDKNRPKISKGYFHWKWDFLQYLNYSHDSRLGLCIGLKYVVRPEKNPEDPIPSKWEADLFEYPLEGHDFDVDNEEVARLLEIELGGTEAYASAKNALDKGDGRQAMLKVIHHYENRQRVFAAVTKVNNLIHQLRYFCNEDLFKFEDYSLNLMHLFNILSNYPEYEMKDSHQKEILFRHIDDTYAPDMIRNVIEAIRCQRALEGDAKSFMDYVQQLRNAIESVHLQFPNSQGRKRKRNNFFAENFDYNPNFRYSSINGVDIRWTDDKYSRKEWSQLGKKGQQYVRERREVLKLGEIE